MIRQSSQLIRSYFHPAATCSSSSSGRTLIPPIYFSILVVLPLIILDSSWTTFIMEKLSCIRNSWIVFLKDRSTNLNTRRHYSRPSLNDVAKIDVGSMNSEEIEKKMKELYQKIDGVWRCLECDYSTTRNYSIRIHIDTHMEGLSYSCNLCNKEFR